MLLDILPEVDSPTESNLTDTYPCIRLLPFDLSVSRADRTPVPIVPSLAMTNPWSAPTFYENSKP